MGCVEKAVPVCKSKPVTKCTTVSWEECSETCEDECSMMHFKEPSQEPDHRRWCSPTRWSQADEQAAPKQVASIQLLHQQAQHQPAAGQHSGLQLPQGWRQPRHPKQLHKERASQQPKIQHPAKLPSACQTKPADKAEGWTCSAGSPSASPSLHVPVKAPSIHLLAYI